MKTKLLISEEEVRFNNLRNALTCLSSHLQLTKGSSGYVTPILNCHKCEMSMTCREWTHEIEKEMN